MTLQDASLTSLETFERILQGMGVGPVHVRAASQLAGETERLILAYEAGRADVLEKVQQAIKEKKAKQEDDVDG
jgi:hypothetical protein